VTSLPEHPRWQSLPHTTAMQANRLAQYCLHSVLDLRVTFLGITPPPVASINNQTGLWLQSTYVTTNGGQRRPEVAKLAIHFLQDRPTHDDTKLRKSPLYNLVDGVFYPHYQWRRLVRSLLNRRRSSRDVIIVNISSTLRCALLAPSRRRGIWEWIFTCSPYKYKCVY